MSDDDDSLPIPPPTRQFRTADGAPHPGYLSPGARKEKLREKRAVAAPVAPGRARRHRPEPYPELRTASAFSFLDGASLPEDLVARAAELELPAVALVDRAGVYGAPRFYKAAKAAGIRALVGAELPLGDLPPSDYGAPGWLPADPSAVARRRPSRRPDGPSPVLTLPRLSLLVASRRGYQTLCRLLTAAARGKPKGEAQATWEEVAAHTTDLCCLTGGSEGPVARALASGGLDAARGELERLAALFPDRLYVELQRHRRPEEEHRNVALAGLAARLGLPLVATNGVRYARRRDKTLHDVLTCIREHSSLDRAGSLLAAQRERHLKGAAEMAALFRDQPDALAGARELASRLDFTLADLGYRFPDYPLPPGETPASYLRQLTWNGARARFRPLTARAQAQIEKELALIEKLDLAGYFLIVWDVVRYCNEERILVQGRGSAANSAVCYALGITAVDPVKMELLFERFLSEERGEWPDIDLDLPSGDQREKVIQHVYRRYGSNADGSGIGAAMTANVITYRDRSAAREVAKTLGWSQEQVDRLAKQLGAWNLDRAHGDPRELATELAGAGFDPVDPRVQRFAELWIAIQNLPRHLGQHSGGMVVAAGRLDEVVPLEPAAMPGRVVVQWDKDDCADLGIVKVDLLGLGMLDAIEKALPMVLAREGVVVDLAQLPPDDPKVFGMLQKADTVGVFQVESRAQMASLPRNHPERFYDLVVQVAIIRPGPIVGGMVNPYFERRRGREPVTYAHPSLEPVLARTLGVPLFQEQILRMAMVTAGFSGGEAEELRRAMGFKRSVERMTAIESNLRRGMAERGIHGATQDSIVLSIKSFALYGFPESHAASFALIAYASAWLKAYHPTAFLIALLNAWPMGFYHPATLVTDARRHGVESRPIDVNFSGWECRWEDRDPRAPVRPGEPQPARGACRLGLKFVKGLRRRVAERIEAEQAKGPFRNAEDLARRCDLHHDELTSLAHLGALGSLGVSRREAMWQVALASRPAGELFEGDVEAGFDGERAARTEPAQVAEPGAEAEWEMVSEGARSQNRNQVEGKKRTRKRSWSIGPSAMSPTPAPVIASRRTKPPTPAAGAVGNTARAAMTLPAPPPGAAPIPVSASPLPPLPDSGSGSGSQSVLRSESRSQPRSASPSGSVAPGSGSPSSAPPPQRLATNSSPLPEMTRFEEMVADLQASEITVGAHPVSYLREYLQRHRVVPAAELGRCENRSRVRIGGAVIVRQRPGTARGLLFVTLEDETGTVQAAVMPDMLREHRQVFVRSPGLILEGVLQKRDGVLTVKAERVWPLSLQAVPSHDFH
jgi:error-prone DNA polymerase